MLALLAEQPCHPFAIARLLDKRGDLGKVLSVRRPLVYRAADRLAAAGLCRPDHVEAGEGGPERTIYRVTPEGRRAVEAWLGEPVHHVRDLRTVFLLKLRLTARAGRSPLPLVEAQRQALAHTFAALMAAGTPADEVALWRRHNAAAAAAFLDDLAARLAAGPAAPSSGAHAAVGPGTNLPV